MSARPLRVLIVDDSRIFRGVIEEALSGRDDIVVVGSVWSGEKAIEFARISLPDFVTLDIEMPGMGGIETLKALRELSDAQQRSVGVLLVSLHTKRGAAVTIEGLQLGAFDYLHKPVGPYSSANAESLREQLLAKIEAFRSRRSAAPPPKKSQVRSISATKGRRPSRFRAVVIGASTGGPEALNRLLPILVPVCPVPMFLVQHLPADFTSIFAENLARRLGGRIVEAQEGMIAESGVLYVARGGKHLVLHKNSEGKVAMGFSDAPQENGCRPAVDVLFRSASVAYSGQILAVVLTGMGSDGARGSAVLKRAGAHIIAQDEATSVVWGMPGSVVAAGTADEVLSIDDIGAALLVHLGFGD